MTRSILPLGDNNHPFRSPEERAALIARLNSMGLEMHVIEDRAERLAAFNAMLAARNLKQHFKRPEHLGDWQKPGQLEIVGIYAISSDDPRFHWDIITIVRNGEGKYETRPMRWNANSAVSDGGICTVFVDWDSVRYVLLTRQWRQQFGEYRIETPRGYAEMEDMFSMAGNGESLLDPRFEKLRGVRTLLRELGEELGNPDKLLSLLQLKQFMPLGQVAQDTGTSTATPDHNLLILGPKSGVDPASIGRGALEKLFNPTDPAHSAVLWNWERFNREIANGVIENYSLTCIVLAMARCKQALNLPLIG